MRALAVFLFPMLTGPVWAADDPPTFDRSKYSQEVTECDRQAGHKLDPYKVVPGKSRPEIDLEAAIAACKAAVAKDPENPRLHYQLGRAYGYSGRGEDAMPHRMKAVEANYPQSLFVTGFLYMNGQTIEKDVCRGAELIRRSAQMGRLAGQVAFPRHALRGDFDDCDVPMDRDEMLGFLAAAEEQTREYLDTMLIEDLRERLLAQ